MSYTNDMKQIKELEAEKRNAICRVNPHEVSGINPWTGAFETGVEYDEIIDEVKIAECEAKIAEIKVRNAEALAKKEAKRKADKAKRYRAELELLTKRKAEIENWLAKYEAETEV